MRRIFTYIFKEVIIFSIQWLAMFLFGWFVKRKANKAMDSYLNQREYSLVKKSIMSDSEEERLSWDKELILFLKRFRGL